MSTAIATPQETQEAPQVEFNPAAYIKARNEGKPAAEAREGATKPVEQKAAAEPAKPQQEPNPDSRRSMRRRELNAIREAAAAQERVRILEEQLAKTGKQETGARRRC